MGLYIQHSAPSSRDTKSKAGDVFDPEKEDQAGTDPNTDDIATILQKRKETLHKRVRKRTNKLLHTHVALILVCVLSTLDAGCVVGQIISDILIMADQLYDYDILHERAVSVLYDVIPQHLNATGHGQMGFEAIIEHLEEIRDHGSHGDHNATDNHGDNSHDNHGSNEHNTTVHHEEPHGSVRRRSTEEDELLERIAKSHYHYEGVALPLRRRRSVPTVFAGGVSDGHEHEHTEHDLLHELTHTFHLGSMAILSALVLETFLKIFAMGKHFLNHKLEMFDAFVVTVSWCLDVAFWEGIWAKPGTEGATILIIILPWRVVRIVNSFVLVIQEKDLVLLKVVKQRLRASLRREKDVNAKVDKYRIEVRQLQGLCRKSGADETAIQACNPAGRRRRSSLFQSLTSLASFAMVSAMGSKPEIDDSSSDDETESGSGKDAFPPRRMSTDSAQSGTVCFTLSPDSGGTPNTAASYDNKAFKFDPETVAKLRGTKDSDTGCYTKL